MNTYQLRKCIHVILFHLNSESGSISYIKNGTASCFCLSREEFFKELVAIGSVDEDIEYEDFMDYSLSQWDALNIAIRYELTREQEKDIDNSDIGKAINKLKNL